MSEDPEAPVGDPGSEAPISGDTVEGDTVEGGKVEGDKPAADHAVEHMVQGG